MESHWIYSPDEISYQANDSHSKFKNWKKKCITHTLNTHSLAHSVTQIRTYVKNFSNQSKLMRKCFLNWNKRKMVGKKIRTHTHTRAHTHICEKERKGVNLVCEIYRTLNAFMWKRIRFFDEIKWKLMDSFRLFFFFLEFGGLLWWVACAWACVCVCYITATMCEVHIANWRFFPSCSIWKKKSIIRRLKWVYSLPMSIIISIWAKSLKQPLYHMNMFGSDCEGW